MSGIKKKKKKKRKSKLKNLNQLPGKVVYVGEKHIQQTGFEMISYNEESCKVFKTDDIDDVFARWDENKITWLNIIGLNNTEPIERVGKHFGIHALVLEDMVNTRQRPKLDEYENYVFLVLKMIWIEKEMYYDEHFSMILGPNYVLTFQEAKNDVFEKIRERINKGLGSIRLKQADFLMYSLLDVIVDHYFLVVEQLGLRLEQIENEVFLGKADDRIVQDIQVLKPEILQLRKVVFPMREMSAQLKNSQHPLLFQKSFNYYRDLHDNCIQVAENVEVYREMIRSVTDMYISTLNNKMNEIMKVLTIMATIFIPLTFIAGVYGMNFENMPELNWKYGYYYVLGFMLIITLLMIWYFKRKKWL